MKFNFCGPSYQSRAVAADAQMTMNFYLEAMGSGKARTQLAMYPTPGLKLFCDLGVSPVRGMLELNGRSFAIGGGHLFEIFANGTKSDLGVIQNDGKPVKMCASVREMLFASKGIAYRLDFTTNLISQPNTQLGLISVMGYSDGFFIALLKDSQVFQISDLNDGASWDATQVAQVSLFPDNIVSMEVDHREIWLLGKTKSTVYYNSGASPFPFIPYQSAYIEQGSAAVFAPSKLDNTLFFIGADERGAGIGWRIEGYTPRRVTTHAIETEWASYPTISDAVSYAYQDEGHSFWMIRFPAAGKTWCYDVSVNMWHQRDHYGENGVSEAHLSQNHIFAFGKHLVGDWKSGKIYEMKLPTVSGSGWDFCDDAGTAIRRVRRSPYVSDERNWVWIPGFKLDCQAGVGPQPPLADGNGDAREPQVSLRMSNDLGQNYGAYRTRGLGFAGDFNKQLFWPRCGRSRGSIFEISYSDAAPLYIVDGYISGQ